MKQSVRKNLRGSQQQPAEVHIERGNPVLDCRRKAQELQQTQSVASQC